MANLEPSLDSETNLISSLASPVKSAPSFVQELELYFHEHIRGDFAQEYSISARHVRSQARITTVAATRPAMDTADAPW